MLDKERVLEAFRTAIAELNGAILNRETTLTKIADTARDVYCRHLSSEMKKPSIWTFRSYVLGGRADAEIVALVGGSRISKMPRIDGARLIDSFRKAIEVNLLRQKGRQRPRTIAVLAHRIYCEGLPPEDRRPALVSFTQRVTGKTADAGIVALLKEAGIESGRHATLDRERLKAAFSECIRKFETRIMKGIARPLHVADTAHKIYTEQMTPSDTKPSRLTFRRLIYGQNADPEIASILEPHFHSKK